MQKDSETALQPQRRWAAPTYNSIVETYELDILKKPGDLSFENGDIALTKDRDLKLGNSLQWIISSGAGMALQCATFSAAV